MDTQTIIYLAAGTAAGGFVNGLAGFGTALFSLGFFLTVLPPVQAIAIVVVHSVISGLSGLWIVRHKIIENRRRLARFLLPAIVGIPFGVMLLSFINADVLKLIVALFLILYGGFFSFRRSLPSLTRPTPGIDAVVGLISGVLGGSASLSGALPTMWCSMRPWTKEETRAVLQPLNAVVLGLTAMMLAVKGAYTFETLGFIVFTLPFAIICAEIGIAVFKRLSDGIFRRLIISLSLFSGIVLLLRQLL